ncbi:MAG TPA: hypothetical protein VFB93_22535, partial [Burkholderiales bacterium]|nr:hypothetical protein [Burkholderiales bacterium]
MTGDFFVVAILAVPAAAAALLALLPDNRASAGLNVVAAFLSFGCALALVGERPAPGALLIVDDLNAVFLVISTFVGFTTSVFSASYIGHELEIRRLTSAHLRFYHAM